MLGLLLVYTKFVLILEPRLVKDVALMKTLAYHAGMLRTKQVQEKKEQQFTLCCELIKLAL